MSDPARKFSPRQSASVLLIIVGALCGLAGGLLVFSDGMRRVAGGDPAHTPWAAVLSLFGLCAALTVAGKLLAGRPPG